MRARVLALDYDGTLAIDGALDPAARAAIVDARRAGLRVLLVTGRILADLARHLRDLTLFDAVVAENGAVLHFPASQRSLRLAPPPPPPFLDELRHRDVPFLAGQCVVEMDAGHAATVLDVIRDTELPLVLLFNRGRLMVLPQAVSKATGLREALRALRLSAHNTIGVGDAENDHQLLAACAVGAAVQWGSKALCAAADEVVPGTGPSAVAEYVRSFIRESHIDPARLGRRRLHLGVREGGVPFELAMRDRNLLIAGDTQSGKSWLAGVLCEQLVLERFCLCVIDPEGEYGTLESLPSVIVLDSDAGPPGLSDVERTLRYPDVSTVIDLSCLRLDQKRAYVRALLPRLKDLRRRTGLPHRIVVDEAHDFLHDPDVLELLDLPYGGYTLVTWHASLLAPEVLSSTDAVLVTRVSEPEEAKALHALRGGSTDEATWARRLRDLELQSAALLPGAEESGDDLVRFRVSARLTEHVRHRRKYLNLHAPAGRRFVFRPDAAGVRREAASLGELLSILASAPDLDEHLRRHDLSRWIEDVFEDRALSHRVFLLEEQFTSGNLPRPHRALIAAIRGGLGSPDCEEGKDSAVA